MEFIDITKQKFYFFEFSNIFDVFPTSRKCFGIFGPFRTINRYFEYLIRILCIFLYMGEHTLKIFFDIFRPQKMNLFDPPKSKIYPEVWIILVSRIWGPKRRKIREMVVQHQVSGAVPAQVRWWRHQLPGSPGDPWTQYINRYIYMYGERDREKGE